MTTESPAVAISCSSTERLRAASHGCTCARLSVRHTMLTDSTVATVGRQAAVTALRRWTREGYAGVYPHSEEQIHAYLLLRKTKSRPRAEAVLATAATCRHSVSSGARVEAEFFLAPKTNFPEGVPKHLRRFLVGEEYMRSNFVITEDDMALCQDWWVFDPSVDRAKLGLGTRCAKFFKGTTTTLATSADHTPSVAGKRPRRRAERTPSSDSASVDERPAKRARDPTAASAPGADAAPIAAETPTMRQRRQRILRQVNSDTGEDERELHVVDGVDQEDQPGGRSQVLLHRTQGRRHQCLLLVHASPGMLQKGAGRHGSKSASTSRTS